MDEDEFDYCYECEGYGDDYSVDKNGELVHKCETCPNTHLEVTWMIKINEWRKKCRKLKLLTRLSTEKHLEE